ncbi:MAG TPA: methyltransferase [Hyphomicrobiaceae bacterium]|nr:methyltransferase [Hyphomicrobiaceae bacterium]
MGEPDTVDIVSLGAQGDGIAETVEGPIYVPYALPGERWIVADGGPAERLSDSPQRQPALCRHFGQCGGCIAQHMSARLYRGWKQGLVAQAFAHRGIDAPLAEMRMVLPQSRRRAVFGIARKGGRVVLGFREEGKHALVDLAECPVLDPSIVAALGWLREMAVIALGEDAGGRLLVTRFDNGLDVAFEGGRSRPTPEVRAALARLAEAARLLRLSVDGDVIVIRGRPMLTSGGVTIAPPPGVFLQAVPEAEAIMIDLIVAATDRANTVADLFCGIGTFTFPLARRARVLGVDSDRRALEALEAAAKAAQAIKPVAVKVRDLFREPLARKEFEPFDAVVFNPPRAGAKAQAEMLAKSRVPTVVGISCNPATLARDARILIDGGYQLEKVSPIDQFLFSPHVEAVAVFRRRAPAPTKLPNK